MQILVKMFGHRDNLLIVYVIIRPKNLYEEQSTKCLNYSNLDI